MIPETETHKKHKINPTIVDVKAIDEKGITYQVEIQLVIHTALVARILYTWSRIYHVQMQAGDKYQKLKPVISIWILNDNLFEKVEECHLPFSLYNQKHQDDFDFTSTLYLMSFIAFLDFNFSITFS